MIYEDDNLDTETYGVEAPNGFFGSDEDEAVSPARGYRASAARPTVVSRPPLQFTPTGVNGSGVKAARVETPRGPLALQLIEPVTPHEQFTTATQQQQMAIARTARRINDVQGDIQILGQRIDAIEGGARAGFARISRESKTAIAKFRKEQRSKEMTNFLLVFLLTQGVQKQLASHTHAANNQVPVGSTATPEPLKANDDNLLLFFLLPALMSPSEGGDDAFGGMGIILPLLLLK